LAAFFLFSRALFALFVWGGLADICHQHSIDHMTLSQILLITCF
jgi:hypothetical protein